ncbi:60S ribosomal protein L5, mitochondrial [Hordeum vulgare]|nr:60S ribosomal protein L5, mitochondrial [Hordeum vulgare]
MAIRTALRHSHKEWTLPRSSTSLWESVAQIVLGSKAGGSRCMTAPSTKEKDAVSLRQSIIRGHGMYNFLVRVLTVMSMLDSKVVFEQGNCVKFFMATEFCEFSPEIEDHFEIFEKPSEGST